jgi:sugar-specific transcriptional regulator TrmB
MNDVETLKQVLTDAGFSQYEADVYLSVLELKDASVADISEISPVPRSRIYGVLENLTRQGYLETYEEDSLRARINDPSTVIEELSERSQRFSEAAAGIEETWEQPRMRQNNVRVFQSHSGALEAARDQLSAAETIVHLAVSPAELETLQAPLSSLRERDVVVRIVLHEGYQELDDPSELGVPYPDIASEVHFCRSLLPFIVLIDGEQTIFGVQSQHGTEYGTVVDDHILSSILHWYFQIQLWEPWDVVYTDPDAEEMTYISIRELIRDLESIRESGETATVRVEGIETFSGEQATIVGTVDDTIYTESDAVETRPFSQPFLQAAIVVSDESDSYTIGGYGAILEDIRAMRITVLSIG